MLLIHKLGAVQESRLEFALWQGRACSVLFIMFRNYWKTKTNLKYLRAKGNIHYKPGVSIPQAIFKDQRPETGTNNTWRTKLHNKLAFATFEWLRFGNGRGYQIETNRRLLIHLFTALPECVKSKVQDPDGPDQVLCQRRPPNSRVSMQKPILRKSWPC